MNQLIKICDEEVRVRGNVLRIARLEADRYKFVDNPESAIRELKSCNARVDLFTFIQRLPHVSREYLFPMEWDNYAAIPITTFDHWWNHQIGFKARNKAKQAQKKGVVIREVPFDRSLVQGIWKIYNESPLRQGKPFSHYGKDLETVFEEEATFPHNSVFIGAFVGDDLIGFIKMVYDDTRSQAGLMNICSLIREREKAPSNALVAQAVRSCAERGISYLVYSNFAYGKKERSSLSDFKERNGFQRIDVPRYYVPLTTLGHVALRLGLHRRLSSRLPEPIAARLRDARQFWYDRKFTTIKDTL